MKKISKESKSNQNIGNIVPTEYLGLLCQWFSYW